MTGRSIPLWEGSTPDAPIPARVKVRIVERQNGRCAVTGQRLVPGKFEFDHIRPLSMGGAHAEANLQAIATLVHREKTAAEAGPRAKADRIRAKHLGLWERKGPKIRSRGFPKRGETRP